MGSAHPTWAASRWRRSAALSEISLLKYQQREGPGQEGQAGGQDQGAYHRYSRALPADLPAKRGDGGGARDVEEHEDGEGEKLRQA